MNRNNWEFEFQYYQRSTFVLVRSLRLSKSFQKSILNRDVQERYLRFQNHILYYNILNYHLLKIYLLPMSLYEMR